jgi:hypothetical protein
VKPGETVFTTSGVFTVPKGVKSIDVFCVGGGDGGELAYGFGYTNYNTGYERRVIYNGNGGNGGGTTTSKAASVRSISSVAITIGAGGSWSSDFLGNQKLSSPGNTIVNINDSNITGKAKSGSGGGNGLTSSWIYDYDSNYGAYIYKDSLCFSSNGGSDGSAGGKYFYEFYTNYGSGNKSAYVYMSNGQGTTTRYFGESDGTLYAGGGGGGGKSSSSWYGATSGGAGGGGNGGCYGYGFSCSANTGGGGGGGDTGKSSYAFWASAGTIHGGNGGSGIAIIRWPGTK